jgi:DNA-binding NarL/FixJ family response regulator
MLVQCGRTPGQCLAELERHHCGLLIVCLGDEPDSGCELIVQAKATYPAIPILAMVRPGDVSLAVGAMKAGAADCLETSVEAATVRSAILGLLERYDAADRSTDLGLTQTESLVLDHILEGRTSRQIADMLHRSTRTVEVHRQAIMHKLGASNRVDLFKRASLLGLGAFRPPYAPTGFQGCTGA